MQKRIAFVLLFFCGGIWAQVVNQPGGSGGGSGTGDVSGPATNHDVYIPQWNGANSKTLKDGLPVATTATASTVAQRNASGEVIAANTVPTGKTPVNTDAGQVRPAMMHASTFDTQTDGATVTWAIASVLNAQATLTFTVHTGSRALNITNPVIGGNYVLKMIQDGTGGVGLTLGTGCTWKVAGGGSGAVTLTNAANALDVLTFIYDGTNCLATLIPNLN